MLGHVRLRYNSRSINIMYCYGSRSISHVSLSIFNPFGKGKEFVFAYCNPVSLMISLTYFH